MVDIVLVHGTTQTAAGFDALVGELASRAHRAIAITVPSGGAETAAGYAELLAAQLPADIDRPVVVGHSAGGLLVPALARRVQARHQVWLAAHFLFHDCDAATLQATLPTVAVCDLDAVYEETPHHDPGEISSTYLLPVEDRTLRPSWMAEIARDRLHVEPVRIQGGHNCYVGRATATAHAIADACA